MLKSDMLELKNKVISLLRMGLNPTVVGMQDDGLYYLFEMLLQGKNRAPNDPIYTFVHVTLNYLPNIDVQTVEAAINEELIHDSFPGDNIFETTAGNVEVVVIFDDLSFLQHPEQAITIADNLLRHYRNKVHFVFVVEDPLLVEEMRVKVPATSSFFEAVIYQKVGIDWELGELSKLVGQQIGVEIEENKLNEIAHQSGKHFGLFKRLYQDTALSINSAPRYTHMLVESWPPVVINALKKLSKRLEMTADEIKVIKHFQDVGLVDNNKINVPMLADVIATTIVKNKLNINEIGKLSGLDLNMLTRAEQEIVKTLAETSEVISRDQVADIIWRDMATEKYSDWAIDQRIARLRRKIIDLGFNIDVQTIYGKGYKLAWLER